MADNIDVTPGTGKTVKTTDVAGEQIQHVVIDTVAGVEVDWTAPVSIVGVDGSTIATVANPFPVKAASTALTDGSTTITTGGTAQNAFAAAAVVNGYEIVNPDATEDMWVSDTTTAVANGTGCIRVAANGGAYSSPPGMKPSAAVSVVAATTGHKFTARRW